MLARDIAESGDTPYLTASKENNAVGAYISHDDSLKEKGNSIFIGGKTFVVTYQEKDYFSNDSHNLALYLKDQSKKTKENQLYMAAAIQKSLAHLYSWGDSISSKKIQKDYVMLPVDLDGNVDYDFMTRYIRAQQKLTIKNVMDWRNKYIATTKQIVSMSS